MLYLFVNTYTGEARWLPLEEGLALGGYWEQDPTQAPFDCDKWRDLTI